ncbi:MAG: CotH kinase family protein [Deltaproteobacteria bacterium]|nr:CotH kinase family protein [Deltaproteobacteria bacterium]
MIPRSQGRGPLALLLLLLAVGCGREEGDSSGLLFPADRLLEIEITLDPGDWELLRHEPDDIGHPKVTCAEQPTDPKYTYFPAEVSIDGVRYPDVAVRKKGGFGSLSTLRPGLKVKTNEYVPGQEIHGLKRLTLNNNHQDQALLRQCLTYGLFADAGLPASRCAFAHVTVNGEDLGVYSHVESIKKPFLGRFFEDDSGNLYEGGGDFRPGIVQGLQPKVDKEAPDCSDLDRIVDVFQLPDGDFDRRVDEVIDLDAFLTFWAMEVITDHWDGFTNGPNNFYAYHDPVSDRFRFIPWGVDSTFEGRQRTGRPSSVFACSILPWRLYDRPPTRERYVTRLEELLASVWDPARIVGEIDRMEALITPSTTGNGVADLAGQIQGVRDFATSRRDLLEAELIDGPPVWPTPLQDPPCLALLGNLSGTFQATWGTLGTFPAGNGTMSGNVTGRPVSSSTLNATAGLDEEGKVVLQLFAPQADGTYAVVMAIVHDPADFVVGDLPFNLVDLAGITGFYDPGTDTFEGGWLLLGGQLTLEQAGTTAGAPVVGSFSAQVVEL